MNEPTLAAWRESRRSAEHSKRREIEHRLALQQLSQAEVAMHRLTGDGDWDAYLGMAQARIDQDSKRIEELRESLESGDFLTSEKAAELRHEIVVLRAKNEARSELCAIPAQIKAKTRKVISASNS